MTSPYDKYETEFFSHLISQLYLNSDVDVVYVCGDSRSNSNNFDILTLAWCNEQCWVVYYFEGKHRNNYDVKGQI